MKKFALVGKANSGKSSLFNLLTGLNQKIGNYAGVTVEKKGGQFSGFEVVDLPGIKSLKTLSLEEEISRNNILEFAENKTPIVFVANGMQLEDSLMLFSEVADLQVPILVVINFKDDLEKANVEIDTNQLSNLLGCQVVLMNSRSGEGFQHLEKAIKTKNFKTPHAVCRSLYDDFENGQIVNNYKQLILSVTKNNEDQIKNDYFKRQKIVGSIVRDATNDIKNTSQFLEQSKRWDKVLLHPIFGILIFLLTILVVFQAVFYLADIPMGWIDGFFAAASEWAANNIPIPWLADMFSNGILPGLGGVLIFIPQIAILFFLLGLLEHSGYLSRISFISNRFLSKFGLSGQSVVPLMSSWACAIPAIMSTRVINDPKERMAVIFASPLMTCAARLPVYTILIAIMVPSATGGLFNPRGLLMFGLYLLGVVATLVIAWLVSRQSKVQSNDLWALELPVYRVPNWRNVLYNVYQKTKAFVVDAGKVIFIVSMVLWLLASFSPKSDDFIQDAYQTELANGNSNISEDAVQLEYSYAGYLGKIVEPVIAPLGYDWKIGIALISSFAAREVFVGSLATIYSVGSEEEGLIKDRMQSEINPVTGEARFNIATCISLLLFYVFALQCMSTMAIVFKETGSWKYPLIQFIVMFGLAYLFAFVGYRLF